MLFVHVGAGDAGLLSRLHGIGFGLEFRLRLVGARFAQIRPTLALLLLLLWALTVAELRGMIILGLIFLIARFGSPMTLILMWRALSVLRLVGGAGFGFGLAHVGLVALGLFVDRDVILQIVFGMAHNIIPPTEANGRDAAAGPLALTFNVAKLHWLPCETVMNGFGHGDWGLSRTSRTWARQIACKRDASRVLRVRVKRERLRQVSGSIV